MKFVVDILHPAHVHFFRNFIAEMTARGHHCLVTAREKDCAVPLLEAYGIEHQVISKQRTGVGLGLELIERTLRFISICRPFGPDVLTGIMGPTIALASKLLRCDALICYDTEMAKITNWFAYPLADQVLTPECYQRDIGPKHVRYPGYHELAYLHPNRFEPEASELTALDIDPTVPLAVVRFVSWQASHDIGETGFSLEGKRRLVALLAERGRVLITSEGPLPPDLAEYRSHVPVEKMHHVLAFAELLVGESATMSSECACLGTHSIFVSRTGRGYTDEQEARYGLVHYFRPEQEQEAMDRVRELLARPDLKADGQRRRQQLLSERIDVTDWLVKHFEDRYGPGREDH